MTYQKWWLWSLACIVLCGPVAAHEIAVGMDCDAVVDDADIRDQINQYTLEIGWLTAEYIVDAQSLGIAQEREVYWRNQRLIAQTPERVAECNEMYNAAFNLRFQIAAKMSRTLNRISILFSLINSLEQQLNQ